jgi:hypothetical protein
MCQMEDYSYCTFENGHLCMRGLHRHGFPLLLWDALVQTGYGDRAPEYYDRLYEEHGLQHCEVYIDIPSHPVFPDRSPWSTWAIGANMDDNMEKVAHMALTALCLQNLPATAGTPSHCTLSRTDLTQSGRLAWMRWAMSLKFITTMAGRTWPDMPSICFSCSTALNASLQSSDPVLLAMPRKSRASPRRSAARPRRLVSYVSRSRTWRVTFMTRKRHF